MLPSAPLTASALRHSHFVAQSHTPQDCCVRFAVVVAFHAATLATGRALPLTRTGLSPVGTRQLSWRTKWPAFTPPPRSGPMPPPRGRLFHRRIQAELPGANAKPRRPLRQPLAAVQQPLHRLRLELPREAPSGSPLRHPSLPGCLGSLANPPAPGGKSSLHVQEREQQ